MIEKNVGNAFNTLLFEFKFSLIEQRNHTFLSK